MDAQSAETGSSKQPICSSVPVLSTRLCPLNTPNSPYSPHLWKAKKSHINICIFLYDFWSSDSYEVAGKVLGHSPYSLWDFPVCVLFSESDSGLKSNTQGSGARRNDGLSPESVYGSCRGPKVFSQHPHGGTQPFITPLLGHPTSSCEHYRHQECTWYTKYIQAKHSYT